MLVFVFFKQNTAYEMRISDWSSDVCSSDLGTAAVRALSCVCRLALDPAASVGAPTDGGRGAVGAGRRACRDAAHVVLFARLPHPGGSRRHPLRPGDPDRGGLRSVDDTFELQYIMRISYAVFCLKKKISDTQ